MRGSYGVPLKEEVRELIDGKNFANIATLMADGAPHVTTVWVDREEDIILVNTARGRVKEKNVARDPRVALTIFDSSNPYHVVSIRGRVESVSENGAEGHINKLAKKYLDMDKYPYLQEGEVRVIFSIVPEHVTIRVR